MTVFAVDHLVNNNALSLFEDTTDITNFAPAMVINLSILTLIMNICNSSLFDDKCFIWQDINFWGSAYGTYFSIPHLRQSKGKIVAVASCTGWLPVPRMSIYNVTDETLSTSQLIKLPLWYISRVNLYSFLNSLGQQSSSDQPIRDSENWIGKRHRNNYSHSRADRVRNVAREDPIQGWQDGFWSTIKRCKLYLLLRQNLDAIFNMLFALFRTVLIRISTLLL